MARREQLVADWAEVMRLRSSLLRSRRRLAQLRPVVERLAAEDPQFLGVQLRLTAMGLAVAELLTAIDGLTVRDEVVRPIQ